MDLVEQLFKQYVEDLKAKGSIRSETVERTFRQGPRHRLFEQLFVEDEGGSYGYAGIRFSKWDFSQENPELELLKKIYSDSPVMIKLAPPSSSPQLSLVAQMLELLSLVPGMNILEIGAGTGYNAALIVFAFATHLAMVLTVAQYRPTKLPLP